ncbi:MAG TPA: UDP-glucose/GDP-mannose dehydrogenase family protein, partial [candidate division Zixibacteria bacterium]|nr:UDP-glucose/GDP-mannose dehydrogenase family protein [candidate division Zixibacteria bacterium]
MNGSNKSTVRIQPTDSAATKAQNGNGPVPGVNICVVGAGFVGLVTAAGFADFGHNVVCVEKDPRRLDLLQSGRLPFYERDLQELITTNVANSRLSFSADLPDALDNQRAIFIAVGTPASSTGRTDLGALEEVTDALNDHVTDNQIVVIKSTAPIGAAGRLKNKLNGRSDRRTPVISNPEFLREGSAVYDFFNPQRIVIGGDDPEAVDVITHIHRLGMKKQAPFVITNNETAEMIKYASNVFLATKIGLVNEIAAVCDPLQVNVVEVARGMGLDPRIGADFLNPGPGWGGSCLPKDISEFQGLAKSVGVETNIAHAVTVANQRHQERIAEKVQRMLDGLEDKNIAALGMAFKADTSDTRNSPALA